MKIDRSIRMFGVLSLALALAPFYPEPHLFGKIRWVMGGAVGMQPMDWFDLVLHGGPMLVTLFWLGISIGRQMNGQESGGVIRKHNSETETGAKKVA